MQECYVSYDIDSRRYSGEKGSCEKGACDEREEAEADVRARASDINRLRTIPPKLSLSDMQVRSRRQKRAHPSWANAARRRRQHRARCRCARRCRSSAARASRAWMMSARTPCRFVLRLRCEPSARAVSDGSSRVAVAAAARRESACAILRRRRRARRLPSATDAAAAATAVRSCCSARMSCSRSADARLRARCCAESSLDSASAYNKVGANMVRASSPEPACEHRDPVSLHELLALA
eukprot:6211257-Pleurochrysis_carterae.AAC.2